MQNYPWHKNGCFAYPSSQPEPYLFFTYNNFGLETLEPTFTICENTYENIDFEGQNE